MRPAVDSLTITSWPQRGETERDHVGAELPAGTKHSDGRPADSAVAAPRSHPHSHRRRGSPDRRRGRGAGRHVRVRPAPDRELYGGVAGDPAAVVAGSRRAAPGDAGQSVDRSAALDRGDAEAQLAAGVRRDAGFDSDHLRRPGRRCGRPCGHVRDAARVGFLERGRERRRCADGHPERARGARVAGRGAGAAVPAARAVPAAHDRRNDRPCRLRACCRGAGTRTRQAAVRTPPRATPQPGWETARCESSSAGRSRGLATPLSDFATTRSA